MCKFIDYIYTRIFWKHLENITDPADTYLFKVNNSTTTRERREICSKLTIKTLEWRHWRRSGVFIVNFENILHPLSSVSIFGFEQVNVSWRVPCLK